MEKIPGKCNDLGVTEHINHLQWILKGDGSLKSICKLILVQKAVAQVQNECASYLEHTQTL